MEKLFEVRVEIGEVLAVQGSTADICMLSFTGTAEGAYFNGRVIGTGVDTQRREKEKETFLSARYMLEGTDYTGQKCRVFIENNGTEAEGFTPRLVTDSQALAVLETEPLFAELEGAEGSVTVSIYHGQSQGRLP